MPAIDLPPRPQSALTDQNGNLRPEWVRWLDALERVVRALNV